MSLPTDVQSNGLSAKLRDTTTLIERLIVLAIIAGLLVGVGLVLRPFAAAILFATILVIATWPVRSWLVNHGVPAGPSAVLLLLTMLGLIGIPAIIVAPDLGQRMVTGIDRVRAYLSGPPPLPDWLDYLPGVKESIDRFWQLTQADGYIIDTIKQYQTEISKLLLAFGGAFIEGLLQFFLSLALATMFWLRGDALVEVTMDIAERLGGTVASAALRTATNSVRGVAYGVVGTAVIQAVALTVGLFIAGVPGWGLLGFVALLIAMSQIGVLLVLIWGGAAWWLFSIGSPAWAIFMIVWGVLVSTGDNAVRPWLVSFGAAMPVALVFLGVFGGFIAFGFLGMFIGPTLLGVSFGLLQAWRQTSTADFEAAQQ